MKRSNRLRLVDFTNLPVPSEERLLAVAVLLSDEGVDPTDSAAAVQFFETLAEHPINELA